MENSSDSPKMSRREVLRLGKDATAAVVVGSLGGGLIARDEIAKQVGRGVDEIINPESYVSGSIPVLLPRSTDTPRVSLQEHNESVSIHPVYKVENEKVMANILSDFDIQAEHTGVPLTEHTFAEVGEAIITSAEGLVDGKQEYVALFRGSKDADQLLAIGYESGMYTYDWQLEEWVRLLTKDNAVLHNATPWENLQSNKPNRLLLEESTEGIKTLLSIGYKPWGAVLPSTKVPDSISRQSQSHIDSYDQTKEDILLRKSTGERFYVSDNGDLIDVHHLWAKTGETLDLFAQLHEQYLTKVENPVAEIRYSPGHSASYQFTVDSQSLGSSVILDTTFQLMTEVGYRMEGVSQRLAVEKIPGAKQVIQASGMMPEDLFSNSLGILSMIALIKEKNLLGELQDPATLRSRTAQLKEQLMYEAVNRVLEKYGVRHIDTPPPAILPAGLYPLIPSKVTDNDNPSHIDLEGVTPNNPAVQYSLTHVPAFEINFQRGVKELLG